MKNKYIKIIVFMIVTTLLVSTNAFGMLVSNKSVIVKETELYNSQNGDIDPLVDLEINVTIKEIRALDKIDVLSKPDFFVKVFVNGEEFVSNVWRNQKYVTEEWSTGPIDVPDDVEFAEIKIQLWDKNPIINRLCDLSQNIGEKFLEKRDIDLTYSLKNGLWYGEDYVISEPQYFDPSGYGRLNGCDDNSVHERDLDCELWFEITQNDFDGDGIPYWTEVNEYGTDPEVDDTGRDDDEDGVPIEWEHKWGSSVRYNHHTEEYEYSWFFDPFVWEDHKNMDWDLDGIDNYEEFLTSEWGSDPFRKDLFVELDQMNGSKELDIPPSLLPKGAKDLLKDAHHRQNIVYHLDDGEMGGSDMIEFDIFMDNENQTELQQIYQDYFLHGDANNWRRGVFHYGIIVWDANYSGYAFNAGDPEGYGGAFQMSKKRMDASNKQQIIVHGADLVYASGFMHEAGHTLGLNWFLIGGHDKNSYYPWQLNWWIYRPYKSCMNYGYIFYLVDYSDGSRGKNDFDDWENIDLTLFQKNIT